MGGRVEWVLTPLEQAGVRYLVVGGVVAREDLIAMKRAAGRARDIEDVEALLGLSEGEP
jgi:hypothetical protein